MDIENKVHREAQRLLCGAELRIPDQNMCVIQQEILMFFPQVRYERDRTLILGMTKLLNNPLISSSFTYFTHFIKVCF